MVTKHNGCTKFIRVYFVLCFMSVFARYFIPFLTVAVAVSSNLINVVMQKVELQILVNSSKFSIVQNRNLLIEKKRTE